MHIVHAHAHCPNVAQKDLIVVIIVVVVVAGVAE